MTLCSLIYASRLAVDPEGILANVLDAAERNNPRLNLTGALVFDHRNFLQLLEGHRSAVSDMFLNIAHDERHTDLRVIQVEDIPERRFPTWSMHHAAIRGNGPVSVRAFMPNCEFEPANLTSGGALALFDEVARHAR